MREIYVLVVGATLVTAHTTFQGAAMALANYSPDIRDGVKIQCIPFEDDHDD